MPARSRRRTGRSFQAALASDHASILTPAYAAPFRSSADVVARLLPYHIYHVPEEDVRWAVEQHAAAVRRADEGWREARRREKRRMEETVEKEVKEEAVTTKVEEQEGELERANGAASAQGGGSGSSKRQRLDGEPQEQGDAKMEPANAVTAEEVRAGAAIAGSEGETKSVKLEAAGAPSSVASEPAPSSSSSSSSSTSTTAPQKPPRLRVRLVKPSSLNTSKEDSSTPHSKSKDSSSALPSSSPSSTSQPPPPPAPDHSIPWWEASTILEPATWPSTTQAISLFERHAALHERLQRLLVRADGGYAPASASSISTGGSSELFPSSDEESDADGPVPPPPAQAYRLMVNQLLRYGQAYEAERLVQDQAELNAVRSRWEHVVRTRPSASALAVPPAPTLATPAKQPSPFPSAAAGRAGSPTGPLPSRPAGPSKMPSGTYASASAASPGPGAAGARPPGSAASTPGAKPAGSRPLTEIPSTPIPLQVPLSALPRLASIGIRPLPSSHLPAGLFNQADLSLPLIPATGIANASVGPSTAPRPAPADQPDPTMLMGVTLGQSPSLPPPPQGTAAQTLHLSVRLDRLQPTQLSGLAALMGSLQPANKAAQPPAAGAAARS